MKNALFLLAFFFVVFSASAQTSMAPNQFKSALEADKSAKLVDVRQDWEFKKGHIENAVNIDVMNDDFEGKIGQIPRSTTVYVYCFSGGRSSEAVEKMKAMGFKKVINLSGGIAAWEKALLPTVK